MNECEYLSWYDFHKIAKVEIIQTINNTPKEKYFREIPKHHLKRIHKIFCLLVMPQECSDLMSLHYSNEKQINFTVCNICRCFFLFIYPSICDLSCYKNMVHNFILPTFESRLNFILIKVSFFFFIIFLLFQISCFPFLYIHFFFLPFVLISWEYGVICVSSNSNTGKKKVNCVNVDFKDDFITFLLLYFFVRCLFAYFTCFATIAVCWEKSRCKHNLWLLLGKKLLFI